MPVAFFDKKGKSHELPQGNFPLIDTHGHLTHFKTTDVKAALTRAYQANVCLLVVPIDVVSEIGEGKFFSEAAEFLSWFEELAATPQTPCLRFVAGAHPYGAANFDEAAFVRLKTLLASSFCVGVGEIGFDFGPWSDVAYEDQAATFSTQLQLAHEFGLPVELHLRDPQEGEPLAHAYAEELLKRIGVPEAGCDIHCFTEGPQLMKPFVDMGCFIAFGGAATFSRSDEIREAARVCPRELIISETDSPFMTPVPLRGSECEPGMIAFTCALLAEIREEAKIASFEQTYQDLYNNALRLFHIDESVLHAS